MAVNHRTLAGLIPHGGAMCLLDEVLHMDDESITCRATSHRNPGHPLREGGILPAVSGTNGLQTVGLPGEGVSAQRYYRLRLE